MLIPNLRAQVACELCRLGGFAHFWDRGQETPRDEFSRAMDGKRNRPRILVLAQRFWRDTGEITIEDLVTGLSPDELVAVCELLQATQGGATAIEGWLRKWGAQPAPRALNHSLDELEEPQGEFRLQSEAQHRRSR